MTAVKELLVRKGNLALGALFVVLAALTCLQLSSYGIWDPWELSAADLGRQIEAGEDPDLNRPPLGPLLVASGFAAFDIHEWAGRLPLALAGLLAVLLAFVMGRLFVDRRAGFWAATIVGTCPLYLLNARSMLGATAEFATTAAVFLCAMAAVFHRPKAGQSSKQARLRPYLWLGGLLISGVLAAEASGVLLGVAPPLLAAAVAVLARGELTRGSAHDVSERFVAGMVLGVGVLTAASAGWAVWADYADYSAWTGGSPRGGNPPTWEIGVERLFHSFAPWSALLPLALARLTSGWTPVATDGDDRADESALRFGLVAWIAFGFLASSLYSARFGSTTFLPLVGAGLAVALLIRDVERSGRGAPGIALIGFLFAMLIVRDFRAYPGGPIEGLPVEGVEIPEAFISGTLEEQEAGRVMPPKILALLIALFAGLLAIGFATDPKDPFARLRRNVRTLRRAVSEKDLKGILLGVVRLGLPTHIIRKQWSRGVGQRIWLVLVFAFLFVGSLAAGIFGFGISAEMADQLNLPSTSILLLRALIFFPFILFGLIATGRFLLYAFAALGRGSYRLVPVGLMALVVAGYTTFGYQPELSRHFSPRDVYETYNQLATAGEPLGEFRVGGRAAEYYATGEIQELASQRELIQFLQQERRVWAAFRADDLAAVNRDYRRTAHQHLFVADARSARMVLATNQPIEGRENQNYLADTVLEEPPRIQHPTDISFDDRIELIGYDLDLPQGTSVGPGQAFAITWYFRVLAPVPGSYQLFVHIDGPGQRINGDHQPVGGRYPVRLWEAGDIVVDRQELRVPANLGRTNLTLYIGFFAGEQRLEVVRGPEDDANRARPGMLPVR